MRKGLRQREEEEKTSLGNPGEGGKEGDGAQRTVQTPHFPDLDVGAEKNV